MAEQVLSPGEPSLEHIYKFAPFAVHICKPLCSQSVRNACCNDHTPSAHPLQYNRARARRWQSRPRTRACASVEGTPHDCAVCSTHTTVCNPLCSRSMCNACCNNHAPCAPNVTEQGAGATVAKQGSNQGLRCS